MLTKQELYDVLKNDGARMPKAANFMQRGELVAMYQERFGIDPDALQEQPNSDKLSDGDEMGTTDDYESGENAQEQPNSAADIPLLKFDESGWCTPLNRAYSQGLYRPKNIEEYNALKKYAAEEIRA